MRMATGVRVVVLAVAAAAAAPACVLTPGERHSVEAWLSCDECDSASCAAVVSLGASRYRHGAVVRVLHATALTRTDSALSRRLELLFVADSVASAHRRGGQPGLGVGRQVWVRSSVGNWLAQRRLRAAQALVGIDSTSPVTLEILDSALALESRLSLRAALDSLRHKVAALVPSP